MFIFLLTLGQGLLCSNHRNNFSFGCSNFRVEFVLGIVTRMELVVGAEIVGLSCLWLQQL